MGICHRLKDIVAHGHARCHRRGEYSGNAVLLPAFGVVRREETLLPLGIENGGEHSLGLMSATEHHGLRSHLDKPFCGTNHIVVCGNGHAEKKFGLATLQYEQRSLGNEVRLPCLDGGIAEQTLAMRRQDSRHENNLPAADNLVSQSPYSLGIAHHSHLHGSRMHIVEHRLCLPSHHACRKVVDALNPVGILNGYRSNCRDGTRSESRDCAYVCLNSGKARIVRACNAHNWYILLHSAKIHFFAPHHQKRVPFLTNILRKNLSFQHFSESTWLMCAFFHNFACLL